MVSLPLPCVKRFIRLNVNTLLLLNFSFHWNIGRDGVCNIDPSSICELLHLAQPPCIRDGEMSHRGSTIMSDVFRKTVKIFNIMSEIPYVPVTG